MTTRYYLFALALLLGLVPAEAPADPVPSPESHLGFRPGADFRLSDWATVAEYYRKVDRASDRVTVRELGTTTEGRPYLVAAVSEPETIAGLGRYQALQRRLADPRYEQGTDDPVVPSKAVVVITCSIHSSETASTFMALELLHELATKDDPDTREVLRKTIVLLVPSANPDGVDKVAAWYERSKGHPWEGSGMPELYHKYAGHDTNRDWFMLNLKETQLLTRMLYREWFPTILYDVHQMSARGPRLFVPPFYDPINPNIDPRVEQGIFLVGAHMAADLAVAGKQGVATGAIYDNWWNGGNRTTPQRHNIVAVLTEAASVKLATPLFLDKAELTAGLRGFPDHRPSVNFVDPWPGGWWRLRDIVDYELVCARSILTLAARYKDRFQTNLRDMARAAVDRGAHEPPYAWVVPRDQADPGRAAELVRVLHETGIEVRSAKSTFEAGSTPIPAGSWILPAAQPYRAHLKDMMERQAYPARFSANGAAEPPYDVAGWTLPLQMGVRVLQVDRPFNVDAETLNRVEPIRGVIDGAKEPRFFTLRGIANDDFVVINELLKAGVAVERVIDSHEDAAVPSGVFGVEANPRAKAVLGRVLPDVSSKVAGVPGYFAPRVPREGIAALEPLKVGLYQPWAPSMDEGWTRFVLERFHVPYTTLHDSDVRAGDLDDRIDTLVLPSVEPKVLRSGYGPNESEPAYVGGLGVDGVAAIRSFVREGGTLVCLAKSCEFAIEELGLPVRNVLAGLKTSDFYCPGSIVRLEVARPTHPLALGYRGELSAYFDRSLAFEPSDAKRPVDVVLRYASTNPLESGWLLGPEKIQGKAALVEVPFERGRVVLFAFPPQNRGQTHGTFRLLFNALLRGAMSRAQADAPPAN
ncbi:MAG: M14 family metallopeptidase [Isosphaeraceae bacterium]|nr:M14 family metallopeptidase [Isosphaeraceae bacterium]